MTRTELLNLINTNIADNAFITPEKDREVRLAMLNYMPRNRGYFDSGDLPGTIVNYAVGGDILTATRIQTTPQGSNVRCVMRNPMDNLNYKVNIAIQSISAQIENDNDLRPFVFRVDSEDTFSVYIENEGTIENGQNTVQDLRVHLDVIQL